MNKPAVTTCAQRGYIMLGLLLIMVIGGSSLVLAGLGNRQSVYQQQQQELHAQMMEAKATLLAYAANSAALNGGTRGPGFFPCPDTDNDGQPQATCNSPAIPTAGPIGRLPEYQDFSGSLFRFNDTYAGVDQQFWYVVGPRYVYDTATTSYRRSRLRTSTTYAAPYWLQLDDTSEYVALLIAPGEALASQDRVAGPTTIANYLEGNNGSDGFNFHTNDGNGDTNTFNDQIVGITYDEYMVVVGAAVARRIKTEIDAYALANDGIYPPDSGALESTSCSSTLGTTFSDLFDSQEVWLRDRSVNNGNNSERWSCPYSTYWNKTSTDPDTGVGELMFNGCANLKFTLTYNGGIVREGDGC